MPTDGERLATVEAILHEIRGDVLDLKQESALSRQRLHKLEGIAGVFVETQKENRNKEAEQYRRLGVRIQVLTIIVGLAAVLGPILTVLLTGK